MSHIKPVGEVGAGIRPGHLTPLRKMLLVLDGQKRSIYELRLEPGLCPALQFRSSRS